jgi:hypothetical protein
MRARVTWTLGMILGLSASAWAGRANYFETSVDLAARTALGSLYDTRHSADNVQYIGCSLNYLDGAARVSCEAKDAGLEFLACSSTDPELIKIAQALTDNGYVYFRCDSGTPSSLTYLYVSKSSAYLP